MEKTEEYDRILADLQAIMEGERDLLANLSNCAAILFLNLSQVNWAGFYLSKAKDLVLGPFQGKPACTRIGPGRGVCGAAALRKQTVVVPDVHDFPGHIACDVGSRSEIVVPLMHAGQVLGVLDVDSPIHSRFDNLDAARLEDVVSRLLQSSDI
jgi:L-methionine (R)-S-oxide reductase